MSIAHDYAEIHKRMLGDNKQKPKYDSCATCDDIGWISHMFAYPTECPNCKNPNKRPQP